MTDANNDQDRTAVTVENSCVGGSNPSPLIPATHTPANVARDMVALAAIRVGHFVLEPSAGYGALAIPARKITHQVHCHELNETACNYLRDECDFPESYVTHGDFLRRNVKQGDYFDRVIMNPPSHDDRYLDHVLHAMNFLLPGGRLVALIVNRFMTGTTSLEKSLYDRVVAHGRLYEVAHPVFVIDGKSVGAAIVVIDRP